MVIESSFTSAGKETVCVEEEARKSGSGLPWNVF